ncbi:rolling circle replication-associated protein [Clostridium perfringens]
MPYREKQIKSGNNLECIVYSIPYRQRRCRKNKKKESLPKQKNLNEKNSKDSMRRTIECNFTCRDWFATFGWTDEKRPKTEERMGKDIKNFFERIRRFLKKNKRGELKYIYVIEYDDNKKVHIHMILNNVVSIEELQKIWGEGNVDVEHLREDDLGYEWLVEYLAKDPKGKKRWVPSRNLKRPEIITNDFKYNNKKIRELVQCQGDREFIRKLYPGYTVKLFEVKFNEISSSYYINIRLKKEFDDTNVRKRKTKNKRRN